MNSTQVFYPEMGQSRPTAQLEVRMGRSAQWLIKTALTLPKMQGLKLVNTLTADQLVPEAQHKVGWNEYTATDRAFAKLKLSFTSSLEALL